MSASACNIPQPLSPSLLGKCLLNTRQHDSLISWHFTALSTPTVLWSHQQSVSAKAACRDYQFTGPLTNASCTGNFQIDKSHAGPERRCQTARAWLSFSPAWGQEARGEVGKQLGGCWERYIKIKWLTLLSCLLSFDETSDLHLSCELFILTVMNRRSAQPLGRASNTGSSGLPCSAPHL